MKVFGSRRGLGLDVRSSSPAAARHVGMLLGQLESGEKEGALDLLRAHRQEVEEVPLLRTLAGALTRHCAVEELARDEDIYSSFFQLTGLRRIWADNIIRVDYRTGVGGGTLHIWPEGHENGERHIRFGHPGLEVATACGERVGADRIDRTVGAREWGAGNLRRCKRCEAHAASYSECQDGFAEALLAPGLLEGLIQEGASLLEESFATRSSGFDALAEPSRRRSLRMREAALAWAAHQLAEDGVAGLARIFDRPARFEHRPSVAEWEAILGPLRPSKANHERFQRDADSTHGRGIVGELRHSLKGCLWLLNPEAVDVPPNSDSPLTLPS